MESRPSSSLLPVVVQKTPTGSSRTRSGGQQAGKRGSGSGNAYRALALGLALVMSVYGTFYVLLEQTGEADCPVCHEVITPATSQQHTESYHALLRERWSPARFHDNATRWRDCVSKAYPGYPALAEYDEHTRPVFVWTWHTLENFLYIHPVRACSLLPSLRV
jgi:hypothetical protein